MSKNLGLITDIVPIIQNLNFKHVVFQLLKLYSKDNSP